MKRIAITGGIGSGKSYVCRVLNKRGIEVYDCDAGAKQLMRTDADLQSKLTQLIGPDTYVHGQLNKPVVSQFLLASEANKQAINAIVHPAVIDDFYRSGKQWMESAILFEAHLEHTVDVIVCVSAPEEVRISRIMQRDGITEEKARQWIQAQMPQAEAEHRSHFVIINDGIQSVDEQVAKVLSALSAQ